MAASLFKCSYLLIIVSILFASPSQSFAVNYPIEAGSAQSAGEVIPTLLSGESIFIDGLDSRSYCCQARNLTSFSQPVYFEDVRLLGSVIDSEPRGLSEPLYPGIEEFLHANMSRVCFIAPEDGSFAFRARMEAPVTSASNVRVQCAETTLFGGYNVVVNTINYLELTNTMRSTEVNGKITITNALTNTTIVTGHTFQIPSGGRTDIAIHDLVPAGVFGNVVVAFDGPAGSVHASLSQYKVTSTNPFAFELITREKLAPRL